MPPAPIRLAAVIDDRAVTLSWEISDTAAVARFRIYAALDTATVFRLLDSTNQFAKVIADLPFNQNVRIRVTSVTSNNLESQPSSEIVVVAGLLQMLIQGGDEYTNARNVNVQFSTPVTPVYVQLSEDPDLVDAVVQEFHSPLPFVLSQGDGVKTVYARLTFADGSESGGVLSDNIILDTYARIDSVYFAPTGRSFAARDTIRFYVAAHGETGGGAQVSFGTSTRVTLRDLGTDGDLVAGDGIYSFAWVVPVGLTVADGVVTGAFTDAAGNTAASAQAAARLNIQTPAPPTAVTLAVGMVDSVTAHLSWTTNTDADFGSYRIYRSVTPNINVADDFLTIAIITIQSTVTHDDFLSGTGIYYYRVFVFNSEGLSAGSNEVIVSR